MRHLIIFLLLASPGFIHGQSSSLSIAAIMQGEKFVGYLPENPFWSEDGKHIYFSWNPDGDTLRSLYKASIQGGDPQKVARDEQLRISSSGIYTRDRAWKVYEKYGDLYLLDCAKHVLKQITQTQDDERRPLFSGDGKYVVYQRGNNLYAWDRITGQTFQLTPFQNGNQPGPPKQSDQEVWLEQDQLALFEVLRNRKSVEETRKGRRDLLEPLSPKSIYLENRSLSAWQISPDMRFVVYRLQPNSNGAPTKVPAFVTESGYVEFPNARPKVGGPQDRPTTYIYDRLRDTVFVVKMEGLPGIFDKPAFLREYHTVDTIPYKEAYDSPRAAVMHGPYFSEEGLALAEIKSLDNKDRWIALINLEDGSLKTLDRQRDEAWIGGPGISGWNFAPGNLGWIDNEKIYFHSEESGFSHLYLANVQTGEKKALTEGNFEILDARLSNDKSFFFLTSNKESPHERHFYRLPVQGGLMERFTHGAGNHQVILSPDEKNMAVLFSYANQPWELFVKPTQPDGVLRRLTYSTTDAFRAYHWRDPQIVHFEARDGSRVPARIYRPPNAQPGGPAVIFVHGAGYLQNVHRWWSTYYREFMFHNFLADNGYTVLDIDFRASEGYGRDWRTAIYRHMGGKDLDDQVDGAAYLVNEWGVDPAKIGIYGGSYGGFITLMALFNSPGTFRCGAALRSVTDWAHYNHPYTSNILNTPVEDSLAFRRSSPIYHAEGLQDRLLILHGMVDDNVQFQDVVRLAQRLIELGKENWEFAVYPVEAHGFQEPSSWADEYRRIFKMFEEELRAR
jgi:dipeptidyl aminopeptidase/acylaminoacyl peptidase